MRHQQHRPMDCGQSWRPGERKQTLKTRYPHAPHTCLNAVPPRTSGHRRPRRQKQVEAEGVAKHD
eukprot:5711549-Pyramimonas_sp.AAC.1